MFSRLIVVYATDCCATTIWQPHLRRRGLERKDTSRRRDCEPLNVFSLFPRSGGLRLMVKLEAAK